MAGLADYIRASNGDGEAVRAIVTTQRGVANTDLITDSVLNWPNKFVATSGTLNVATGLLEDDTISVFKGHLTGSIITIEEFAPGYSDIGHEVGQVVVLKPSTLWADIVSQAIGAGGATVTIGTTPPATPSEGDLWGDTNTMAPWASLILEVGNALHPIGSIYMSVNSANPSTYLGFGTWVAWGSGRVPVGVDTGQTEFDTVEETGGAKTHTLTVNEMPSHDHTTTWNIWFPSGTGPLAINDRGGDGVLVTDNASGGEWYGNNRTLIGNEGGGAAHNNLQPYITCYMWKRTA